MARKQGRKNFRNPSRKAHNALEIAQRELGDEDSGTDTEMQGSKRNGAVINLLKRVQGAKDEDLDEAARASDESFEDEELDSDEALGSEDEFDVLNSKISQTIRDSKKAGKGHTETLDSDGDNNGYNSFDEKELVSLSEVWDMDNKGNDNELKRELKTPQGYHFTSDTDNSDDNISNEKDSAIEEEEEEDESEENYSDKGEEDPFAELSSDDANIELKTVTSTILKGSKKPIYSKLGTYGTGNDSEYNLPAIQSIANDESHKKISVKDLLKVVDGKDAIDSASLVTGKSLTVEVPLPQRIQQRHDRQAAYEISKDEMDKWRDIVQQNRKADHLDFTKSSKSVHNNASAFVKSLDVPQTELQEKVEALLETSNLAEPTKDSTFEELATAKITPEEMRKRTIEMRLMRELMFQEERKAKRLKKIKSKTYRRIKKKELMRNNELTGASDESDTEKDIARAKERMTLKHKTNSRWAKDMIRHGMTNDANTREEVEEMLKKGEQLRMKIRGDTSDDDRDESLSQFEDKFDDRNQTADLKSSIGKSGLLNMAFMKNAENAEKEQNKETLERLRVMDNITNPDLLSSEDEGPSDAKDANVIFNKGRRIYTPGALESKADLAQTKLAANDRMQEKKSRVIYSHSTKTSNNEITTVDGSIIVNHPEAHEDEPQNESKALPSESSKGTNPWLDTEDSDDEKTTVRNSSKVKVVQKDSSQFVKGAAKINKRLEKLETRDKSKKDPNGSEEILLNDEKLNLNTSNGAPEFMFEQQNLISEAFAGDDVVSQFEQDKHEMAVNEDDQEIDVTLAGWGSWTGAGTNPRKKRKFIKKVKGVVTQDKRRDKNLKDVIINEKLNKKNMKYQSSAVPFPYENKEQYERSLRMPIGQEWTSRATYQSMIKPRIMTKPSQVVDPLKAPFK